MADKRILQLITGIFKEVYIPYDILKEVKQLTLKQASSYGFIVYYPDDDTYFQAANISNSLSFEDNICIIDSKKNGWALVTNDRRMRDKCLEEKVEIFWGLQLMIILVEKGKLLKSEAVNTAEKILQNNPRITGEILEEFKKKIHGSEK